MKKTLKEQNQLIAQSNSLVEGKYNYSLWELRVFIEMVQSIERDDQEFKPVRIYLNDLTKQYDTKNKDSYRKITQAATRLIKKVVRIEYTSKSGEERIFHSPLVVGVDVPKQMDDRFEKYIELEFPEKIRPLLLDLKKNYLIYDKQNILNLKSKFSVRIYQIFKSHEREMLDVVIKSYKVTELRAMLLVDENGDPNKQYKQYGQFEEKVILKAQAELEEKTDIAFTFEKIKRGRTIHSLTFYIRKNRKKKPTKQPEKMEIRQAPKEPPTAKIPDINDPIYQTETLQKLIEKGILLRQALKLVSENEEGFILDTLVFCEQAAQQGTVKNLPAFIVSSIKNKSFVIDIEQRKIRQAEKQKRIEAQKIKDQNHTKIKNLEIQFTALRDQKIKEIKTKLTTEEEQEITQIAKNQSAYVRKKTDEEVKNSVFFDFVVLEKYAGTEYLPKKEADFFEWMKVTYKTKIAKNTVTDKYEIIG